MKFEYQARTKEGELQVGFVEAVNKDNAATILASHELFILKLESAGKERWYSRLARIFKGVRRKDMVVFTRQLATLLESHLSLEKALAMLYEQTQNQVLKEGVFQISQDIAAGLSLSQAMERQPHIFSQFYISMVRSAEVTGKLTEVVGFLADYTEQEAILVGKARSAMTYPAILLILFGIVSFIMVTVVFPQVEPIFAESGVELPLFSRVLMSTGIFLGKFWFIVVVVFVFMAIMFADYIRTDEGKAFLDDLKVKMPILYKIYTPIILTRFGNASRMLIKGGVPVAQAIEIVSETIDNVVYKDILRTVASDVRQGRLLSESLSDHTDYFPLIVSQMVAVGEATGQLDQIFTRITTFYQREADSVINNLVDLVQPVLLVVIGLMVGLLFASILLPIYELTSSIT